MAARIEFLSTLSLRRATNDAINGCNPDFISIHALLAESDHSFSHTIIILVLFLSTLSLRRATQWRRSVKLFRQFLSTLSLRRASPPSITPAASRNFYPRSPCGERSTPEEAKRWNSTISIHALLAESDHYDNYNLHCVEISIHALLAESDSKTLQNWRKPHISIHALLAESDTYLSIVF